VADGRVVQGQSHIVCDNFKKIKVRGTPPRIYAICGLLAIFDALIDWHETGAKPDDVPKVPTPDKVDGWAFLVIDRSGPKLYQNTVPYPYPVTYPFAMGCGDVYALTLLDAGFSPEEAVRSAFKREAHAGGEIQVVNIAEALGQLREAAE
jgi:hypothetical protein